MARASIGALAALAFIAALVASACEVTEVKAIVDASTFNPDGACLPAEGARYPGDAARAIAPRHQGRCAATQLESFSRCIEDFDSQEAECKAIGFDPTKSPTSAVTGDCAKCLYGAPGAPGSVLRLVVTGEAISFALDEGSCVQAFLGDERGAEARAPFECATVLCGPEVGCRETDESRACERAALEGACAGYVSSARRTVDGTKSLPPADLPDDAGHVSDAGLVETLFVGDASTTTREAPVTVCGRISSFSGGKTPREVAYALAAYFCGP